MPRWLEFDLKLPYVLDLKQKAGNDHICETGSGCFIYNISVLTVYYVYTTLFYWDYLP